jgi:hypothetical protein
MAVSCRVSGVGMDDVFAAQLIGARRSLSARSGVTEGKCAVQNFLHGRLSGDQPSTCTAPLSVGTLSMPRIPETTNHSGR